MALKLKKTTQGTTTAQKSQAGKTAVESVGEVPGPEILTSPDENGTVGMEASMTINLGNYESVRLGVTLHLPCSMENYEERFGVAREFVEETLAGLKSEVE